MFVNVEVRLRLLLLVSSPYATTSFVLPITQIKANSKAVRGFYLVSQYTYLSTDVISDGSTQSTLCSYVVTTYVSP